MPGTINVDIAALRRLGADLIGLSAQLNADNKDGTCIGDWISDPRIRTALKDVQHDWSDKRGAFTRYLDHMGATVQQAAACYAHVDQKVKQAATPCGAR